MTGKESLNDRVAHLEASVERIEKLVKTVADRLTMVSGGRAGASPTSRPSATEPRRRARWAETKDRDRPKATAPSKISIPARDSQWWLSRIGIALSLFGVLYLFKYAVDQGWLSPLIRVLTGIGLGTGLMILGVGLHARRGWYARALLVGGIITHFIAMYAAFHWYDLVSQLAAIAVLSFVSLLALALAIRLGDVSVAVTGAAGALLTPIVLYDPPGSIPFMMAYLAGTLAILSAVFLATGWRTFIWASFYVAWSVLLLSAVTAAEDGTRAALLWTTLGIAAGLISFWFVPLIRERLVMLDPEKWKRPPKADGVPKTLNLDRHAHVLSVLTPLVALLATAIVWDLSRPDAGWIALGMAVLASVAFGVVSFWPAGDRLAFSQAITVVSLLTLAFALILDGNALLVALSVEAAALHLIGLRMKDEVTLRAGQAILAAVAFWVLSRLITLDGQLPAVFNPNALVDALLIGIALFLATKLRDQNEAAGYSVAAHVLILAWIARELSSLPNGGALVTLAWGAYGIGLLIYALTRRRSGIQRVAMATLLIMVAKLFLVDLAQLAPVWRIILFMGFGGLFLILSYFFQDLGKPAGGLEEEVTVDS
ncbi:MAG: DUF2339 domain-containing protein [Gemmatimonadales bacterium]